MLSTKTRCCNATTLCEDRKCLYGGDCRRSMVVYNLKCKLCDTDGRSMSPVEKTLVPTKALQLQNQKPMVFLGVLSLMFPGVGSNFHGVPSCSKENVLGKDHLSQRNPYKNFFDYKM